MSDVATLSLTPTRPPTPDWEDAAEVLDAHHAEADATARAVYADWLRYLHDDLVGALKKTLAEATRAHEAARDQLTFGEATGAETARQQLMAYRQDTEAHVLKPLQQHLADAQLGHALNASLLRRLATLATHAADAPETLTVRDDDDLHEPDPKDGLGTRLRKARLRFQRKANEVRRSFANTVRVWVGRERKAYPFPHHTVPLRALLRYHLEVRIPYLLLPIHEEVQQDLARYLATLEDTLTQWTRALLVLEQDLDRPAFHQPPAFKGITPQEDVADANTEHPTEPMPPDLAARIRAEAATLHAALEAALAAPPQWTEALPGLHAAEALLARDLTHGGTPLLRLRKRALPAEADRAAQIAKARGKRWIDWHGQVENRLRLNLHLLSFRRFLLQTQERLLQRLTDATLRPVLETFMPLVAHLRTAQQQAISACDTTEDPTVLRQKLDALQNEALAQMQHALRNLPGLIASSQALTDPGKLEWEQIRRALPRLPEALRVHISQPHVETPILPEEGAHPVNLRGVVADAFVLPFATALAEPADELRKEVVRSWGRTEEVQNIIQYNLEAALDELENEEANPAEAIQAARELAVDGLGRAANTLLDLVEQLEAPWLDFVTAVFKVFRGDWRAVQRRALSDDTTEEQWLGFQTRLRRQSTDAWQQLQAEWSAGTRRVAQWLRLGRRQAQQLIRRGQSAVGVLTQSEEDRLTTLDAISDLDALQERLPLVYRKLFAFEPVEERALLDGRDRDLIWVKQHFERWQQEKQAGMLVVSAPMGSGRTSFLNVLAETVMAETDVRRVDFRERPTEADAVAAYLADALGFDLPAPVTMDALEAHLTDNPRPEPPLACLLDNLEHLVLRTPGGQALLDRVLIFFSRTDTRIYWLGTLADHAWQYLEKTGGAATGFVTHHALAASTPAMLEALLLNRHRRSGMTATFADPTEASRMQRLRRSRLPEERQAELRQAFFDNLYRLSGQNLMLALFYWLRAVEFHEAEDRITVHPLKSLKFDFLSSFDLARAFTMKAFLLHHTLNLDEHNRIFRMSDAASTFILESLLNLRLIEPVGVRQGRNQNIDYGRITPDARYRLHPLAIHPITQYLRARHIIY